MTNVRLGGWVRASAIGGDPSGTECSLCRWSIDSLGGWVNPTLGAFVCARCLRDPDAEGERVTAELVAAREAEQRVPEGWVL